MQRSLTISRLTNDQLQFRWSNEALKRPASIFWGHSPNGEADDYQPLTLVEEENELVMADPSPGRRSYFLLVPAEGQSFVVAERRLPLVGQVNFRDLGGYVTNDGRRVRWGQLYRSGDLSRLTGADLVYLESLNLKLVCDLRVDFELERSPDRLPGGAVWHGLPVRGGEMPEADLYDAVDNGNFSGLDVDYLVQGNRLFVREFTPAYAEMLQRMAAEKNRPAIVHCTAGKDRAGLGAAIILLVLGVPMETVFGDYLLSNTYRAGWTERMLASIRQAIMDRTGVLADSIDLSPVEALFVAKREYLAAAMETINQEYGSFEAYVRDGLAMSPGGQEAFRDSMLT